jgi:zinc transporter 7
MALSMKKVVLLFILVTVALSLPQFQNDGKHSAEDAANCPVAKALDQTKQNADPDTWARWFRLIVKRWSALPSEAWNKAIGSAVLIGLAPITILFLVPTHDSRLLSLALAFAAGGLLGDVFLHLIPHALHAEHVDEHMIAECGWNILIGVVAFFVIDVLARVLRGESGHAHSHGGDPVAVHKKTDGDKKTGAAVETVHEEHIVGTGNAILNLIADFSHNFTDGLAIGIAFALEALGRSVGHHHHHGHGHDHGHSHDHHHHDHGHDHHDHDDHDEGHGNFGAWMTVIAILLHEVPHELGDFAVLIQSGVSRNKALALQVLTAAGCVLGTIVGLLTVSDDIEQEKAEGFANSIMPVIAGGFLYIALSSIIPELLLFHSASGVSPKQRSSNNRMLILQIVCLIGGIYFMNFVASFE